MRASRPHPSPTPNDRRASRLDWRDAAADGIVFPSQTGCGGQAVEPRLNPTRTAACHPDPQTEGAVRPLCAEAVGKRGSKFDEQNTIRAATTSFNSPALGRRNSEAENIILRTRYGLEFSHTLLSSRTRSATHTVLRSGHAHDPILNREQRACRRVDKPDFKVRWYTTGVAKHGWLFDQATRSGRMTVRSSLSGANVPVSFSAHIERPPERPACRQASARGHRSLPRPTRSTSTRSVGLASLPENKLGFGSTAAFLNGTKRR